jgi:hypothetical protein
MIVNNEFEKVREKVVVAQFKILFRNFPAATLKNHESLSENVRCPDRDSKWALPEYKSQTLPLERF